MNCEVVARELAHRRTLQQDHDLENDLSLAHDASITPRQ
jgi:hypothetical protein